MMALAIHAGQGYADILGIPCFACLVFGCPVALSKAFKRRRT